MNMNHKLFSIYLFFKLLISSLIIKVNKLKRNPDDLDKQLLLDLYSIILTVPDPDLSFNKIFYKLFQSMKSDVEKMINKIMTNGENEHGSMS